MRVEFKYDEKTTALMQQFKNTLDEYTDLLYRKIQSDAVALRLTQGMVRDIVYRDPVRLAIEQEITKLFNISIATAIIMHH